MTAALHDASALEHPCLFQLGWESRRIELPGEVSDLARRKRLRQHTAPADQRRVDPRPGADLVALFEHAADPEDTDELVRLFLSRVEGRVAVPAPGRAHRAELWQQARRRRTVSADEVLSSPATIGLVKELFNVYFRDDLYGDLRADHTVILSSGSVDEELFGLPGPMRDCVGYALQRDWYGYSDSRGRDAARRSLCACLTERAGVGTADALTDQDAA